MFSVWSFEETLATSYLTNLTFIYLRFPTVRGVSRRGIDVDALKKFMCSQGASRRVVNMEWSKFWAENKKDIDKYAKRFMAIDKVDHVALTITNVSDGVCFLSTDYLPKDPSFGKRLVRTSKRVLLEKVDCDGMEVGENIVLTRWGKHVCCFHRLLCSCNSQSNH